LRCAATPSFPQFFLASRHLLVCLLGEFMTTFFV
jgi:hypothetical protein